MCARSVDIFLSFYCLSGEASGARHRTGQSQMSFSNPDGAQWLDLILSKSHIQGPFRSQNMNLPWLRSDAAPPANICKTRFIWKRNEFYERREGRCKDFSLVFAPGFKDAGCWIFLLSVWVMGQFTMENVFCFITNGLCLVFNQVFVDNASWKDQSSLKWSSRPPKVIEIT